MSLHLRATVDSLTRDAAFASWNQLDGWLRQVELCGGWREAARRGLRSIGRVSLDPTMSRGSWAVTHDSRSGESDGGQIPGRSRFSNNVRT